jgi:YggT family protein
MDQERDPQARPGSWRDSNRRQERAQELRPDDTDGAMSGRPQPSEPRVDRAPPPPADPPGERVDHPDDPAEARGVGRRSGADRRVADQAVDEERRIEARRQRDRELGERRAYMVQRVTLGVDYLFYLLYGLLGIRFVLSLLGAAETAGFVVFIRGITDPFYAPFSGIVARPAINGGVLDLSLVIALLAYVLLHIAVRGLLRLLAGDRTVP